ncbi:MAG: site-2 protease family protein [Patescibacteria group bacterium]|nr:site-2 protease family protein [Patescibacteria group bacterium]
MIGNINLEYIAVLIVSILLSLTVHEFMHAYAGYVLGDHTAKADGRLSLNPLSHIDPLMTVALPIATLLLFGAPILAAKPVPFDPRNVRYDEFGAAILAAAGPLSNLVLAFLAALLARAVTPGTFWAYALELFVTLNVALFIFNMLPIPPLDGSRVLYAFAPESLQRLMIQLEPYGLLIVFGLVLAGGLGGFLTTLNNYVLNLLP